MPDLCPGRFPPRLAALAVPLLALAGCGEPPAVAAQPPLEVRVQDAKTVKVSDIVTLTGAIQARVQSDMSFRFAGRIATRNVEVGDHVEAGQLLAKLETSQQEADVAASKAGVAAAEATLRQASATFDRQQSLMNQGFTTRTQYDNANQALQAARADLDSKKSALGVSEDALNNAELRADHAGIITARHGEAGQVVDVAQPIYTLAQDGPRDAIFEVYESLVVRPPASNQIRIALLSDPSVTAIGQVREVAPAVNPETGTVRVKVAIADTPPAMSLGAAVAGSGEFNPREAISLPASAFFSKDGRPAVWVVDPATNKASELPVEVDSFRTGELLLRSGLKDGDRVVTAGTQFLRPGEVVTPVAGPAQTSPEAPK